jgi:biopolymer transport protein ExbB
VVYDRWMAFRANRKIDTRALRSKVMADLRKGNIAGAISECKTARGPIASVLLAGLRSYQQLKEKGESTETMRMVVAQVMEDYEAQAMGVVNKRLDVLTTIGTAAPLLGMTGTVTGMIASFSGLADAGSVSGSGGAVAEGISEALVTTAVGLIIALFAVIPKSVFNRWSDEIELEIEESTTDLVEFILTHH